jgi:hypothetical protein
MYKVIHGKKYNTDTAKLLGTWRAEVSSTDYKYFEEYLYRTKSGNFFIYGEGGPDSPYRQQVEYNTWKGSESIIPISFEQAKIWAEEHLDSDEYKAIFGSVKLASNATLTISAGALKRLRQIQSQSGKTLKAIIDEMLGI